MLKHHFIHIQGQVGLLETIYIPAQNQERGIAIINHPNPLQGGSNTNKVIQTAAKALSTLGYHCYLPNLRGVGNSQGEHEYGKGETNDCISVIDYARQQHSDAPQFILCGFSFGGYVATFVAQQREPDLLLLIAPALNHYTDRPEPTSIPDINKTLIIHGSQDEVVSLEKILDWSEAQELPVITIAGSSHFFHGKLITLRDAILRFAPSVLNSK